MRKLLFLLLALFTCATTWADDFTPSNTKVYTITNQNTTTVHLYYNGSANYAFAGTDATDNDNHKWAIYTVDNKTYIYNIGAKKFLHGVTGTSSSTSWPLDAVNIHAIDITYNGTYYVLRDEYCTSDYDYLHYNSGYTYGSTNWTASGNNSHWTIAEAGDLDSDTQSTIETAINNRLDLPETGQYYFLKGALSTKYLTANGTALKLETEKTPASLFYITSDYALQARGTSNYADNLNKNLSTTKYSGVFEVGTYGTSAGSTFTYKNNGRYMFGGRNTSATATDRGSSATEEGYQWYLEKWTDPSTTSEFTTTGALSTSQPTDGYYVVKVYSKGSAGYLTYNSSLGRKYRVTTTSLDGTLDNLFVWQISKNTDGTFTMKNVSSGTYVPADASRNSNCSGSDIANIMLADIPSSDYTQANSWFAYQTNYNNGGNILYFHCNAPADGYGNNLSYWDGNGLSDGASVCQFAFIPATMSGGHTITFNYYCDSELLTTKTFVGKEGAIYEAPGINGYVFDAVNGFVGSEDQTITVNVTKEWTITLNYTYNGEVIQTKTVLREPDAAINAPSIQGYTFTQPAETATADATIEIPCTPILDKEYYYIANDNENGGSDIKLQLSDENGTLTAATTDNRTQEKYIWKRTVNADGYYQFQNLGTGKYLAHKGVQDAAYNFRIDNGITSGDYAIWSVAASRYQCIKYDGTLDQAASTFNKTTTNFSSDFIFEEAVINTLTITTEPAVSGIFTWNGNTKLGSTITYAKIQGATVDDATISYTANGYSTTLSATSWDGESNANVTATMTPAFLTSASDYEANNINWVRIENVRNAYALKAVNGESALHSSSTDVASENQLFAIVGNSLDNFKIYSKSYSGSAFGYDTNTEGSAVTYGASNTTFKAIFNSTNTCPGYNIVPTSNESQSMNMYGGAGADIKYYGVGDGGSTWMFVPVTEHTITIALASENPYPTNYQLAKLTTSYGNSSSTSIIKKTDIGNKTLYIPTGLTPSLSVSYQYHGYTNSIDDNTVTFAYDNTKYQYLWYEHPDYQFYRIPAIVTTYAGDLIAFSDYRYCHNDIGYGRVDQGMRISTDNGATWSEPKVIVSGTDGTPDDAFYKGFGDPALCADRESNNVLLMTVAGNNSYGWSTTNYFDGKINYFARFRSTDGGKTWSEPENISDQIYQLFATESTDENAVTRAFIGSGKIFQSRIVKVGDYYRIYAALCAAPNGNRVIYSDDFGETWSILGGAAARPVPSGDEPKCEELPDGSVIISSRKYYGRYFNIFTYSATPSATTPAEGTWGECVQSNSQTGGINVGANATNGEIMVVRCKKSGDDNIYTVALQSIPFGDNRSQVGLYWKDITDESTYKADNVNSPATFASNWTRGIQVENIGYSAYSTFTLQDDGNIGFYYEESPGTYAMVYVPLSISEITNGAYDEILPENRSISVKVSSAHYSTLYAPFNVTIPTGVNVYGSSLTEGSSVINLTEVNDVIPAKTGVILYGEEDTKYTFTKTTDAADPVNTILTGVLVDTKAPVGSYVLQNQKGTVGFYVVAEVIPTVTANHCYYMPETQQGTKVFTFDSIATAISSLDKADLSNKTIYNLQGQRIKNIQRGVNIIDGKKYVVR